MGEGLAERSKGDQVVHDVEKSGQSSFADVLFDDGTVIMVIFCS